MALFKSVYDALAFAYNFNSTNVVSATWGIPPAGDGRGLGGLDGAAETGNIKRIVSELGALPEAVVVARFAPDRIICSCGRLCCKGWYVSLAWVSAIRFLVRACETECFGYGGDADYRKEIVARRLKPPTDGGSVDDIVERLAGRCRRNGTPHLMVSRATAYNDFDRVRRFFGVKKQRGVEDVVMDAVDERLRKAGIVGSGE